ncbi:hypothetical protein RRG08_046060 [Elysia crispata]|uniref:Uncharacterized protein n=1 Tax=Elysia crispata TaxID=231223 RepID=A0AAE1DQC9_9GAST|nr:hypothetical protein RRG08_046060 [Elysia crispata]
MAKPCKMETQLSFSSHTSNLASIYRNAPDLSTIQTLAQHYRFLCLACLSVPVCVCLLEAKDTLRQWMGKGGYSQHLWAGLPRTPRKSREREATHCTSGLASPELHVNLGEREATHCTSGLASPELHVNLGKGRLLTAPLGWPPRTPQLHVKSREREATHSTSGLASPELHVNLGKGRLLTAPLGWPPQNSTTPRKSREREATHSTSGLASPELHVNLGKGGYSLHLWAGLPRTPRKSREREATHCTSGLASPDDNFAALLINLPRKLADFASRDR